MLHLIIGRHFLIFDKKRLYDELIPTKKNNSPIIMSIHQIKRQNGNSASKLRNTTTAEDNAQYLMGRIIYSKKNIDESVDLLGFCFEIR
jgi:hypothetical protein